MSRNSSLRLFSTHRRALIEYARRIVGNRAQAEDIVQETWVRFDTAERTRRIEDATGYLYRIARNLALDSRRRSARESRVVEDGKFAAAAETCPDGHPTPEMVALYKDEYARVSAALAELPERTRIAVEMHCMGGAKLKEIAAFLNISVSLVHVLVADGVQHCKRRLSQP